MVFARHRKKGRNIMSSVAEILGCQYPLIQGAMGVISNPEMVAAVSESGGFGYGALVARFGRSLVCQTIPAAG